MATSRIFVSHSHQDSAFCREYVNGLRATGADVWYDEHNLGWGALRATIEQEMPKCQHFVGILSPAAVASEWVNSEIDAALALLQERTLQTLTFVLAEPCVVPLLLRRWKRIEGTGGTAVGAEEAVARTAAIVGLPAPEQTPPSTPSFPPARLVQLGYAARQSGAFLYIVPPLCEVPAGTLQMGSDKRRDPQAYDSELPLHLVPLGAFQVARFPVTVAEYACFVATGQPTPGEWTAQQKNPDHPVVRVSWRNATAYAAWLALMMGQSWWLPTEAQWEWAARGADGRIYPWGDRWDPACANISESGPKSTTPVGIYSSGASQCGAQDMAGNVWEWTSSAWQKYPNDDRVGSQQADSTKTRVRRGGSCFETARLARVACRSDGRPGLSSLDFGFRLACAALSA